MELDPFGSIITQNCKPTSSQQLKFRNCPFARESDLFPETERPASSSETGWTSEEHTGIVMVSVSDSSKEDCCEDAERGVDLGNDSDNLGFSELKSNEVFENRRKKTGDSESESSEPLVKISRVLDVNYDGSEDTNVDVIETEVIESELEENNGEGLCHSSVQTQTTQLLIDNTVTVNVDQDVVTGGESDRMKFVGSTGGVPVRGNSPEKNKDLIDVLKMVVEEIDDGCSETSGDFLETAKKRGMDFPRPRWWPPAGGFRW